MSFRVAWPVLLSALIVPVAAGFALDLDDPGQNYLAFMRTRGDLAGDEVVFYWTGDIYSFVPGQQSRHLFAADGYNIGRLEEHGNGYRLLTREVFVYRDPDTGEILEEWANPYTGDTVGVIHVWNDPVNSYMPRSQGDWEFSMPYTELPGGEISWNLDILLAYPSPLPADSFPEYSGSNLYQGAELFHFFVSRDDLADTTLTTVSCRLSWTRFGQWLPWMRMADRSGYLVYHCAGAKLPGGFEALPEDIRALVADHDMVFSRAPEEYTSPNQTSWTYFRRLLEAGGRP
ncbi:MAG: DUF1838 family protein [Candidatus Fermentibacterota bacterium]